MDQCQLGYLRFFIVNENSYRTKSTTVTMKKPKFLLLLIALIGTIVIAWGCKDDDTACRPYTGVVLSPTPCSGKASLIIQVTNRDVGSKFIDGATERKNVIIATVEGIDSVGGSFQFRNETVQLSDTIYFNFEKQDGGGIVCPALFATPSLSTKITSISNSKCPNG